MTHSGIDWRCMMTDELLLTINEAARRLSVGRSFFYQLVQSGEIKSVKLGRSRRIPLTALEEFTDRRLAESEA